MSKRKEGYCLVFFHFFFPLNFIQFSCLFIFRPNSFKYFSPLLWCFFFFFFNLPYLLLNLIFFLFPHFFTCISLKQNSQLRPYALRNITCHLQFTKEERIFLLALFYGRNSVFISESHPNHKKMKQA